jgi:hypothetical protein
MRWAGAALAALCAAIATGGPVAIDSYGFWSFARLGFGAPVLHEDPQTGESHATLHYRLPADARQGPGHWYLIRLHFRVDVSPHALPGEFNVAAETQGLTCASIIFEVTRRNGRLVVSSDALGLVNGVERVHSTSLERTIDFWNYVGYRGVAPGENTLTLDLTANAIPMVRRVVFLPGSGIALSRLGPPRVSLDAHFRERTVRVGDLFHLDVTLRHTSGIAVPDATVEVDPPPGTVEGPTVREMHWGWARRVRCASPLPCAQGSTRAYRSPCMPQPGRTTRPARSSSMFSGVADRC